MIIFITNSSKSTFIIIIMLKTRQKHFAIGVGQVQPGEYSKSVYIMQIQICYAQKKFICLMVKMFYW